MPSREGTCPACRRTLDGLPAAESSAADVDQVWQDYAATSAPREPPTAQPPAARGEHEELALFVAELRRRTPLAWVTPFIVAVNVVIFVLLIIATRSASPSAEMVLAWGANFGPRTLDGQWWRLFSSLFLHFGIVHVGLNMWVLWGLGGLVERLVGNIGFLVLYLVSGLAGSLASLAWDPTIVSAGASGAVFGVCGALLGFLALHRDSIPPAAFKSLRSSMLTFVGYNLAFGVIMWGVTKAVPGGFGIDNAAHLGGLAAGFLCGLALGFRSAPGSPKRRVLRGGLLALLGGAAIVGGCFLLPPPPLDVQAEYMRFAKDQVKLLRRFDELERESQSGKLTDAQLIAAVEEEILARWKPWRLQIARLESAPHANPEYFQIVGRSMLLREQSWEALVAAIRQRDPELLQQHREKWEAADAAARELHGRR
jgi:rhomboid protease GluP